MTLNAEFGHFLRSRRARLRPEEMGLPTDRRRRAAGLRREEVAQLAGISTEWYVKLEQGRATSPSEQTLASLASVLRLDAGEEAHLRRMASRGDGHALKREHVPASLRALVASLPEPAYVTGRRWELLAWNDAAAGLFGDFGRLPAEDRNILAFTLTDPVARELFGTDWGKEARRMVVLFRASFDLRAGDPAFTRLVERLRAGCPEFEGWWGSHDVGGPASGTKRLRHPEAGHVRYNYATFQANDDQALKLAIYTRVIG